MPFTAETRMSACRSSCQRLGTKMRTAKARRTQSVGLSNWRGIFPQPVTKTVDEISHRVARRLSSRPTC